MTLGMKLRNHSQSRNPATPGRTLVRERCFVGEGKFDSAKREGKCVSMRQTLVPVTEAQGCMRTWCLSMTPLEPFFRDNPHPEGIPTPFPTVGVVPGCNPLVFTRRSAPFR